MILAYLTMMDLLANAGTPLLLVNLVFAVIALAIGFAAGAWVCGGTAPVPQEQTPAPDSAVSSESKRLQTERTLMASDRLRDLAAGVATDVGAHSASLGEIEARLAKGQSQGDPSADDIFRALSEIAQVNEELQGKLSAAEQQIQSQAEQIRTHESEARTDSLTNLANRRAFDNELNRRFAEWERRGTPVSLLILDVDHFKKFNDTHGHQAGDEVLRQVATTITACVRDMDLPCRYGGEEFAVIMPATEAADGGPLAERIRTAIEAMQVEFEGKTLAVTTSLGLAGAHPGDDPATLIKRADEALYASKEAGRNNAHRHTTTECVPITPGKATRPAEVPQDQALVLSLDALPNRTRFLELLRTEVRAAQDAGTPLAILVAEFKAYQDLADEFGEAVAKLTLDSIAQFLDNAIQEDDLLGRLDDGQFIILLPRQTDEQARQVGSRINTALGNCSVPLGDRQLKLTTSMGVTAMQDSDTAVSLMRRSEDTLLALYTDKVTPSLA